MKIDVFKQFMLLESGSKSARGGSYANAPTSCVQCVTMFRA